MDALVIGGHGYAGSRLVEKYVQEGFSVTVLDREEKGYQRIPRFQHRFYPVDFYQLNAHRFVEHKRFDLVAITFDDYRLEIDQDQMLMLLHSLEKILHIVGASRAKKLLFLSSCSLYDRSAAVLTEKTKTQVHDRHTYFYYMAEKLCISIAQIYQMESVILRVPEVYGEGQNLSYGRVPWLLQSEHKKIQVNPDQEFACLYIGDLIEAMYKASVYSHPPVLNLAADDLWHIRELRGLLWYSEVEEVPLEPCPAIDNSLAKRCLDWVPLYDFYKGFERVYDWYESHRHSGRDGRKKKRGLHLRLRPAKAVLNLAENLALFAVCVFLTLSPLSVISSLSIDFNLLYIVVVGSFFGIRQSMLASVLASGLLLGQRLAMGIPPSIVLTDLNSMIMILTYLSVAIGLGYVIETGKEKLARAKRDLDAREQDYQTLNTLYLDNIGTLHQMEEKIMLFENSSSRLVDTFLKLDTLASNELCLNVVRSVGEVLDAEWAAIYFVSKNRSFLRLAATNNEAYHILRNSVDLSERPKLAGILKSGQMLINTGMDPTQPSMIAPLMIDGECVAVMMADLKKFTDHTQYKINLFKVLVRMVDSSFANAYEYESKIVNEKYISDSNIVTENYFVKELQVLLGAGKENTHHFTVLRLSGEGDRRALANRVFRLTRDEDILGEFRADLCLILNHTGEQQAEIVRERLRKNRVESEIIRDLEGISR